MEGSCEFQAQAFLLMEKEPPVHLNRKSSGTQNGMGVLAKGG
jgi:hypothetical protein